MISSCNANLIAHFIKDPKKQCNFMLNYLYGLENDERNETLGIFTIYSCDFARIVFLVSRSKVIDSKNSIASSDHLSSLEQIETRSK
jgi:hypothetical protein